MAKQGKRFDDDGWSRTSLSLWATGFAAALLPGCFGLSDIGLDCTPEGERCSCTSTEECAEGLICLSEVCVDPSGEEDSFVGSTPDDDCTRASCVGSSGDGWGSTGASGSSSWGSTGGSGYSGSGWGFTGGSGYSGSGWGFTGGSGYSGPGPTGGSGYSGPGPTGGSGYSGPGPTGGSGWWGSTGGSGGSGGTGSTGGASGGTGGMGGAKGG